MSKGYYCLIQFCPDFARAETANVGVLLFRPEPRFCGVTIATELDHLRALIANSDSDRDAVREAAASIAYRIENAGFRSVEDLESFVRTRGNDMQLTAPRPLRVDDPDVLLERLFRELVELPKVGTTRAIPPRRIHELDTVFAELKRRAPDRVSLGESFSSSILPDPIETDYAYRNGHLNLVKTVVVPRDVAKSKSEALSLSMLGDIVQNYGPEPGAKLTVVAAPAGANGAKSQRAFASILTVLDRAEFVSSEDVDAFARRVQQEILGPGN